MPKAVAKKESKKNMPKIAAEPQSQAAEGSADHFSGLKLSTDLPGLYEINTLQSVGLRSIPPTAKSAFLELYFRQNMKERLLKEEKRLQRRKNQTDKKLAMTNKSIARLFSTAAVIVKDPVISKELGAAAKGKAKCKVLGY